ncbi:MAG TPA: hypothetical protein VHN17_07730 [Steroidobacteraceae bacterium]|jgi:hypothetical protein|nr:hypothetical protein [Steroidobacteraceae bacterium]
MNEKRACGRSAALRELLKAVYEYAAFYGSMLVFGLLCPGWSLLALQGRPGRQ